MKAVLDPPSKLTYAMKFHVQIGPIGQVGVTVLQLVTAELNLELERV